MVSCRNAVTASASRPATGRATRLTAWFRANARPLPWRSDRDPYRIWVAEVLLQQTRVEAVTGRYRSFVQRFPTVASLAAASEGEVLKEWEGAGYYARARHLRKAAQAIVAEHDGALPRTAAELETLPGVGPYIAAAVASLAFGEPVVALEANGLRVAARWTRESGDVRSPAVRARLQRALAAELPVRDAATFNEAVMELGETVCLPRQPRCPQCPVAAECRARQEFPDPGVLPTRRLRPRRPHVVAAVVALTSGGRWLVRQRPSTGLLGGLWELPGGHLEPGETTETAASRELREETGLVVRGLVPIGVVRHAYSHFTVELHLFRGDVPGRPRARGDSPLRWVTRKELERLPRPAATVRALALLDHRPAEASRGSGSRPGRRATSSPAAGGPRRRRAPEEGTPASRSRRRAPR